MIRCSVIIEVLSKSSDANNISANFDILCFVSLLFGFEDLTKPWSSKIAAQYIDSESLRSEMTNSSMFCHISRVYNCNDHYSLPDITKPSSFE